VGEVVGGVDVGGVTGVDVGGVIGSVVVVGGVDNVPSPTVNFTVEPATKFFSVA
jgi:hypothetical protein